jgi:hypothetical protein
MRIVNLDKEIAGEPKKLLENDQRQLGIFLFVFYSKYLGIPNYYFKGKMH